MEARNRHSRAPISTCVLSSNMFVYFIYWGSLIRFCLKCFFCWNLFWKLLTLSWSLKWKVVLDSPLCNFCYFLLVTGFFEMLLKGLKISALTALVAFHICQDMTIWWHKDLAMSFQQFITITNVTFSWAFFYPEGQQYLPSFNHSATSHHNLQGWSYQIVNVR